MKDRTVEGLILDAKDAIVKENFAKFKELESVGATQAAAQQLKVTLEGCADLLKYAADILQDVAAEKRGEHGA